MRGDHERTKFGVVGIWASNWRSFLVEGGGGLFFLSLSAVSLSILGVRSTED